MKHVCPICHGTGRTMANTAGENVTGWMEKCRQLERELAEAKDDCLRLHREKMDALFTPDGLPRSVVYERELKAARSASAESRIVRAALAWHAAMRVGLGNKEISDRGVKLMAEIDDALAEQRTESAAPMSDTPRTDAHINERWFDGGPGKYDETISRETYDEIIALARQLERELAHATKKSKEAFEKWSQFEKLAYDLAARSASVDSGHDPMP